MKLSAGLLVLLSPLVGISLVACSDAAAPTAPGSHATPGATMNFNPQPEPPPQIFMLEAAGQVDGRWTGMFGSREGGFVASLSVENISADPAGEVIMLAQTWTFFPPEPIVPPDPIVPPEPILPVTVELRGTLSPNGRLVLNGTTDTGIQVHVQGNAMLTGGTASVGGEVMFNPQPEPPPGS